MRSKEDIIREQRTVEAVRKGLMSGEGKLACVARMLGDKVYGRHGGGRRAMFHEFENMMGLEQNFLEEDELEEGEIPTADAGMAANAYLFNGYSRGLHLEIKFDGPEIWVRWKGEIVYHEMSGELGAFAPGDWEMEIEKLAVVARKKEYEYINLADQRDVAIGQRMKEQFLEEMKRKWGLK
jgi:hypothetical protein